MLSEDQNLFQHYLNGSVEAFEALLINTKKLFFSWLCGI